MNNWTILKTIEWTTGYLTERGVPEARLNAEHLLAHSLGLKRMDLYLQFERMLSKDELSKFKPLIKRRATREPLQHILGTQPFRKVDIEVTKDVLIPRPETEVLVGEVLNIISESLGAWVTVSLGDCEPESLRAWEPGSLGDCEPESLGAWEPGKLGIRVLELGTGSGAIAAALASENENTQIWAVDNSSAALKVAEKNISKFKDRIHLLQGDLFGPVAGEKFDIIISNPPYVPIGDWKKLEAEVRDFEPKEALVAGEDGLDFYRRIVNDAPGHLKDGGKLVLELGLAQAEPVKTLAENAGFKKIEILPDLAGKERVLVAELTGG